MNVERTFINRPRLVLGGGLRFERDEKRVFNDISLIVREGECVSLVGPSGSGKTTLFNMILGLDFPTSGVVRVAGVPVRNVNSDCGIVFQKYPLFPFLTVLDNIAAGRIYHETSLMEALPLMRHLPVTARKYASAREEARSYLSEIGLSEADGEKYPQQLSGGMQQRVAIAQALIAKPRVLLLDEPFSGLDHTTCQEIRMFLMRMQREHNLTVVLVTHDLESAIFTGTRVLGLTQYYTDSDGKKGVGARIALDLDLLTELPGSYPRLPAVTVSAEFERIKQLLKDRILDKEVFQPIEEFDLRHVDAVHPTRSRGAIRHR